MRVENQYQIQHEFESSAELTDAEALAQLLQGEALSDDGLNDESGAKRKWGKAWFHSAAERVGNFLATQATESGEHIDGLLARLQQLEIEIDNPQFGASEPERKSMYTLVEVVELMRRAALVQQQMNDFQRRHLAYGEMHQSKSATIITRHPDATAHLEDSRLHLVDLRDRERALVNIDRKRGSVYDGSTWIDADQRRVIDKLDILEAEVFARPMTEGTKNTLKLLNREDKKDDEEQDTPLPMAA